jgi:hypothetical protein
MAKRVLDTDWLQALFVFRKGRRNHFTDNIVRVGLNYQFH